MEEMRRNVGWKGRLDLLTADDRLYFLSYGFFMIISILSNSFYYGFFEGKTCMWLQIICLLILVGYEYRNGFLKAQQWVPGLILVAMTFMSLRVAFGSMTRLVPMMFPYIYCGRRIPFVKIVRFTLKYCIITISLVVISAYLGLIDNVVMYKAGRVREFLGFRYALYLPGILLNITAMWVYLRKDKVDLVGSLFWGVVNWYAYYMTDSRVSFLVAEGLLVLALLMKWLPKVVEKLRPLWAMLIPSFALLGGVSVVMTMIYDWSVPWMRQINSLLDGRLNLGLYSINKYGITLFGQQIEWVGNGLDSAGNSVEAMYDYVDNLYVKMLLRNGTIFTVLMAVFATWAMYRLWKRREYMILIICATVAVQGLLSDLSLALHFNTFWIAMGFSLFVPQNLDRSLPKTENDEPPGGDGPNDEDG